MKDYKGWSVFVTSLILSFLLKMVTDTNTFTKYQHWKSSKLLSQVQYLCVCVVSCLIDGCFTVAFCQLCKNCCCADRNSVPNQTSFVLNFFLFTSPWKCLEMEFNLWPDSEMNSAVYSGKLNVRRNGVLALSYWQMILIGPLQHSQSGKTSKFSKNSSDE